MDLGANTIKFYPNYPILIASNETRSIPIDANARTVGQAYEWSVVVTLRIGNQSFDVVIDDHGSPFKTASDGHELDLGDLPPEYRLQNMPPIIAGTAYLSAIWSYPPSPGSRLRRTGPFTTYSVMNSGWNESYSPTINRQWADRQIAWQRELLHGSLPPVRPDSKTCDEVFHQLPTDSVAGFGNQIIYVGIGGSSDATLKAVRMKILTVTSDDRPERQKTEINCANARSLSRGAYTNENNNIRASFSNEKDKWRDGGIYQRTGSVTMPLGQYPNFAVLAIGVSNLTDSGSVVSYTLEVDVEASNGQVTTLSVDDAGRPFKQGNVSEYTVGNIATYCPTPNSAPVWHVRPGSEYIDGVSLPCIAPTSPTLPN